MKSLRFCLLLATAGLLATLASCGSKDKTPVPTVKFAATANTYGEDIGTVNVQVKLSAASGTDVVVNFTWAGADTTVFLGGDFTFEGAATTSVTIPAGSLGANIQLNVIDDTQIDGDDIIDFTLTSTSANAALSGTTADKSFELTISDNDAAADNAMQLDLTWVNTLKPQDDIDAADLDLMLIYDVTIDNTSGQITASTTLHPGAGENAQGFETVSISKDDADKDYYILVNYVKLNHLGVVGPDMAFIINYTAGQGFTNNTGFIGLTSTLQDNYYIYSGPHTKSGSTISRQLQPQTIGGQTYYKFKANDFIGKKK